MFDFLLKLASDLIYTIKIIFNTYMYIWAASWENQQSANCWFSHIAAHILTTSFLHAESEKLDSSDT